MVVHIYQDVTDSFEGDSWKRLHFTGWFLWLFHHRNQHVPFQYLSYYSKVMSMFSERRQKKIFLKIPVFSYFFFVSLLPGGPFKVVKLDTYGSVKVFMVQHIFSLVHVNNNSIRKHLFLLILFFFLPFTLKTFKAKAGGGKIKRKILPFGLNPSALLWSTQ